MSLAYAVAKLYLPRILCLLVILGLYSKGYASNDPSKEISESKIFKGLEVRFDEELFYEEPEFNTAYLEKYFPVDSISSQYTSQAASVMEELERSKNYIDRVSANDLLSLPVGIKKEIGNITYTMGVSHAKVNHQFAEITVFVQIILPQKDINGLRKKLFFGASNIKLSYNGGILGDKKLILLGDVPIPINGGNGLVYLKGAGDMSSGDFQSKSYVTIDCNGFKELGIAADVIFSRKTLIPVDSSYRPVESENARVKASFETIVSDWNNILTEISFPPFQLAKTNPQDSSGKAGVVFDPGRTVLDFSDLQNSSDMVFPEGSEKILTQGNQNLWRGVYVNSLKIILPEQFKKRNSNERISIDARHLLIDGMGVSGHFVVENLIDLNEGDASGWQFSVDRFELSILTNNIVAAGFGGKIVLPVTETAQDDSQETIDNKVLHYRAIINPVKDDYVLTVAAREELDFDLFQAKAVLKPNSYIELRVEEKRFKPTAVLHGELNSRSAENPEHTLVKFKDIKFQNLQLQTESPYFRVDYMGYSGEVNFANFPVTISEIGITAKEELVSLHFDFAINLMGSENGFAGKTSVSINAGFEQRDGLHRWRFSGIETDEIHIDADLGSIKMKGIVEVKNNDPVYGNGFYGELEAGFNGIPVSASAWFGKTDHRCGLGFASKTKKGADAVETFVGGVKKGMVKNVDDFLAKIPSNLKIVVERAFVKGTIALKYADDNLILYRWWGEGIDEFGHFLTTTKYIKGGNARRFLALPNKNPASKMSVFKLKKGTPYIDGKVTSKIDDLDNFGVYAEGGGTQIYILDKSELIKQ